jgi:opacity protein-like surface antigen
VLGILLIVILGVAVATEGLAQTRSSSDGVQGYDYKGPYAQFGVSIGQIDFDPPGNIDNNASGGFNLTGGYRALPWISGEFNFTYLGGGSVEAGSRDIGNGSFFAFTFGPKVYPLGAFPVEQFPEIVQPYATIQIGGGEFHVENSSFDRSAFMARFILGFDVWITDHIGAFVEGGGFATDQDNVDGVGIFTVGGQYRF